MTPRPILQPDGMTWLSGPEHRANGRTYQSRWLRATEASELIYPADSLLVVGGSPGVGKSTLIARVVEEQATRVDPDAIRIGMQTRDGLQGYHSRYWPRTFAEVDRQLASALSAGSPTVLHLTATRVGQLAHLGETARLYGREAHVLYLDGDLDLCKAGQKGRESPLNDQDLIDYLAAWEYLKERLAGPDEENLGPWSDTPQAFGFRSTVVMDRAAADQLEVIRFR